MNCCPHNGSAHESGGSNIPAGARCTIPGCPCPGYLPRVKKRAVTSPVMKVLTLFAEGLDGPTIAARLGVSPSFVYHARKTGGGSS